MKKLRRRAWRRLWAQDKQMLQMQRLLLLHYELLHATERAANKDLKKYPLHWYMWYLSLVNYRAGSKYVTTMITRITKHKDTGAS